MRRWLPLVPFAATGWAAARWWPQVRNEFFVILGNRNESGGWYGFNSGAAGAFYMSVVPAALIFYCQHTCHDSWRCLRWGKYPAAGGLFRLCRHHHPDLQGQRPHRELIHRMHAEHKERQR
jgi:hypothetical protein